MAYAYVLTSLTGVEQSELAGASGKRVAVPLGSMATAGVNVRLDHPDADFLLEGDALLKVYDTDLTDPDPIFHGRLITADEVATAGQTGSVAATFADPFWTLFRRLVGKSPTGYSRGSAVSPVDRGTIISEIVAATNAESPSGVRMGTVAPSSTTYVAGWTYAKIAEKIAELAATLDGPDWRVRPIEYAGGYYGELDVAAAIGGTNLAAAFEYGDGLLNVKGYKRAVSLEGTINRAYHLPPGFPESATQAVLTAQDTDSQAARGLLEDVVASSGDLTVDELRVALLAYHIALRAGPRQSITFEPVTDVSGDRVPRFGRDFNVGDVVPLRASLEDRDGGKRKRLDALFRIYQVEVTVDEAGAATYALTVTPSA